MTDDDPRHPVLRHVSESQAVALEIARLAAAAELMGIRPLSNWLEGLQTRLNRAAEAARVAHVCPETVGGQPVQPELGLGGTD